MATELSSKMSDYLAEIYRLSEYAAEPNGYVSTSTLADMLNVTAPAVNRMITKLKEMGLLHHEPYQGIRLTDAGRREALLRIRKHRIAEAFLVNVMGFGWQEVFHEAQRMSSAMSDSIATRMLEMAQTPTRCPHGEPIPTPEAFIDALDDVVMAEAEAEQTYVITRVTTREADRLEYIQALGLVPGTALDIIHKAPFNGPMQLKLNNEYRIIGHNLAELIYVRPV
jgi:DtxR family Mn-dependent transcriptional regulator